MIRIATGILMAALGVVHFLKPTFYGAILPTWASAYKRPLVFWSGVAEVAIGLALLYPPTAKAAALALLMLMACFLPLHLYHLYAPPFPNSWYGIYVGRAVLQFGILWFCWWLYKTTPAAL